MLHVDHDRFALDSPMGWPDKSGDLVPDVPESVYVLETIARVLVIRRSTRYTAGVAW